MASARHPRESGDPAQPDRKSLGSRMRGNDTFGAE